MDLNRKYNFDTFNGILNNDRLLYLYKDLMHIMEEIEKLQGKINNISDKLIIKNKDKYNIENVIENYNEFLRLISFFFDKIKNIFKIKKPEIRNFIENLMK